ncbi:MAG: ScyD/ScyE family protein, partial [Solirubrobacteraceae bacterium]
MRRGAAPAPRLTVVAGGLANPRQLSVAADGALYVADAGNGGCAPCATDAETKQPICLGPTGSVLRIQGGRTTTVVGGLPSVASADGQQASGPADVVAVGNRLAVVVQDTHIDARGANRFGVGGRQLGRLVLAAAGSPAERSITDFAAYEATHNPDRGAGAAKPNRIESDPYGLVAYRGGHAAATAAATIFLVDPSGRIHPL